MLGHRPVGADAADRGVRLRLARGRQETELETDHVLAATGYRIDAARLPFLDVALRDEIVARDGMPVLSSTLESSARGVHFVGLAAAATLGPVMRFVCGSGDAAARVAAAAAPR